MNKQNRKGAITDIFIVMILAFVFVAISIAMYYVGTTTQGALHDREQSIQSLVGNSTNVSLAIDTYIGAVTNAYENLKWITVAYIFGLMLAMIVTSVLVTKNPVYFAVYVLAVLIGVSMSAYISNAYEDIFLNSAVLGPTANQFVGASWFFLYLPYEIAVIGFLVAVLNFINMVRISRAGGYTQA
jgi:hypothetical protein